MDLKDALNAVVSEDRSQMEQAIELLTGAIDIDVAKKLHEIVISSTGTRRYLARGALNQVLNNLRSYLANAPREELCDIIETLGEVEDSEAKPVLLELLQNETTPSDARLSCLRAFELLGSPEVLKDLVPLLLREELDKKIMMALIHAISRLSFETDEPSEADQEKLLWKYLPAGEAERVIDAISLALDNPDHRVRSEAARFMRLAGRKDVIDRLREQLRSPRSSDRLASAYALGSIGDQEAMRLMLIALDDEDDRIVAMALSRIPEPHLLNKEMVQAIIERLIRLISIRPAEDDLRTEAENMLSNLVKGRGLEILQSLFENLCTTDAIEMAREAGLRLRDADKLRPEMTSILCSILLEDSDPDGCLNTLRWHFECHGKYTDELLEMAMKATEAGGDPVLLAPALSALLSRGVPPEPVARLFDRIVMHRLEKIQLKCWLVELAALTGRCRRSSPGVPADALACRFEELCRLILLAMPRDDEALSIARTLEELLVGTYSLESERAFETTLFALISQVSALSIAATAAGINELITRSSGLMLQLESIAQVIHRGADAPVLPFLPVNSEYKSTARLSTMADSRLHILAGEAARISRDMQTAIAHFEAASRLDPGCLDLHYILLDIYKIEGLTARYLGELEILGDLHADLGELDKANKVYSQALEMEPLNRYIADKIKALPSLSDLFNSNDPVVKEESPEPDIQDQSEPDIQDQPEPDIQDQPETVIEDENESETDSEPEVVSEAITEIEKVEEIVETDEVEEAEDVSDSKVIEEVVETLEADEISATDNIDIVDEVDEPETAEEIEFEPAIEDQSEPDIQDQPETVIEDENESETDSEPEVVSEAITEIEEVEEIVETDEVEEADEVDEPETAEEIVEPEEFQENNDQSFKGISLQDILNKAQNLVRGDKPSSAIPYVIQASKISPVDPKVLRIAVDVCKQCYRLDVADRIISISLSKKPKDPALHIFKGELATLSGELQDAFRSFEIAINANGSKDQIYLLLRDELITQIKGFNHPRMIHILRLMETFFENSPEIEKFHSEISAREEIFAEHSEAILKGENFIASGKIEEAIHHFDSISTNSHEEAHIALSGLEKIYKNYPDPGIRLPMAKAYAALHEWDAALRNLRGSEKLGKIFEANLLYVNAMMAKGQPELALELIRSLKPSSEEEINVSASICNDVASVFKGLDDKEKAEQAYNYCLLFDPENEIALKALSDKE